jgi:polysaccharide pyruvyl transferase WcaK-like protein
MRKGLQEGPLRILLISSDRTSSRGVAINLGDSLLTDALAEALRANGHSVVIADFGQQVRIDGTRTSVSGVVALLRLVRRADRVIVGGGTMLQDDVPGKIFGGLPRLCLSCSVAATLGRRPITYFAVGADPIARRRQRLCLMGALRMADRVVVRDKASQVRAERLSGRPAMLGADAALLLKAGPFIASEQRSGLILALNRNDARLVSVGLVSKLNELYGRVSFLSMDQGSDSDSSYLPDSIRQRLQIVNPDIAWADALCVVGQSSAVMASRMHALYLAALTSTPAIAVGARPKVSSFADEFLVPLLTLSELETETVWATVPGGREVAEAQSRLRAALDYCGLAPK